MKKNTIKVTNRDQEIGSALKLKRIQKGFTGKKVAQALGISLQQLQKYEKGTNRIAISRFEKYCEVLGLFPGDFFKEGPHAVFVTSEEIGERELTTLYKLYNALSPQCRKGVINLLEAINQ